jgi:hypothetical protein
MEEAYLFADAKQRVDAISSHREHSRFVNLFIQGLADGMHTRRFYVKGGSITRCNATRREEHRRGIQQDVDVIARSTNTELSTAERISTCRSVVGRDNGLYLQTGVMLMWASDNDGEPGADADHRNTLFPSSLGTANSSLWTRNMVNVVAQTMEQQTLSRLNAVHAALRARAYVIAVLFSLEETRQIDGPTNTIDGLGNNHYQNFIRLWNPSLNGTSPDAAQTKEYLGGLRKAVNLLDTLFTQGAMRDIVNYKNTLMRAPCSDSQNGLHKRLIAKLITADSAIETGLADLIRECVGGDSVGPDESAGWSFLLRSMKEQPNRALNRVRCSLLNELLTLIHTDVTQIITAAAATYGPIDKTFVDRIRADSSTETESYQALRALALSVVTRYPRFKLITDTFFGQYGPPPILEASLSSKLRAAKTLLVTDSPDSRSSFSLFAPEKGDWDNYKTRFVSTHTEEGGVKYNFLNVEGINEVIGSSTECYDDGTGKSHELAAVAAGYHGLYTKDILVSIGPRVFSSFEANAATSQQIAHITGLQDPYSVPDGLLEAVDDKGLKQNDAESIPGKRMESERFNLQINVDAGERTAPSYKEVLWELPNGTTDSSRMGNGAVSRMALYEHIRVLLENAGLTRTKHSASLGLLQLFEAARLGEANPQTEDAAYSDHPGKKWAAPYHRLVGDKNVAVRCVFTGIEKDGFFTNSEVAPNYNPPFGINEVYLPVNNRLDPTTAEPVSTQNGKEFAKKARWLVDLCKSLPRMTPDSLNELITSTKRLLNASERIGNEMNAVSRIYTSSVESSAGTSTRPFTTNTHAPSASNGNSIPDSEARERRMSVWADAMRELSITGDPLYAFVRQMAGEMHDDINSIVRLEDRSMDTATRQRREQRREMIKNDINFQNRIMETVLGALIKDTKLRLDVQDPGSSADDISNRTVVVNSESLQRLNELKTGQSGLPFFQANQELEAHLQKLKGTPMSLTSLLEDVRSMLQKSSGQRLRVDHQVNEEGGASMDYLMQPRVSYVIRMTNQAFAAIRDAYDIFTREWYYKFGYSLSAPTAYFLIEGGNYSLSNDFARLAAYSMARSRMNASNSSAYLSVSAAKANVVQLRMQLSRLMHTAQIAMVK